MLQKTALTNNKTYKIIKISNNKGSKINKEIQIRVRIKFSKKEYLLLEIQIIILFNIILINKYSNNNNKMVFNNNNNKKQFMKIINNLKIYQTRKNSKEIHRIQIISTNKSFIIQNKKISFIMILIEFKKKCKMKLYFSEK